MNGLDPAGIHEVRDTMRRLGESGKTVLLSSHLLAEVEQTADRVSIISRGRLLASGDVQTLLKQAGQGVLVGVREDEGAVAGQILQQAGFAVQRFDPRRLLVIGSGAGPRAVNQALAARNVWADELRVHSPDLEQVFLGLTSDGGPR